MALTLSDPASDLDIPLWQAQELRNEKSAALNATPITATEAAETFLSSLEQDGRAQLSGTVTGLRLSNRPDFAGDPETALGQWAVDFEAFVNGGQGDGYTLSRDYRGDSFQGVIETASWRRAGGAPLELSWDLEFIRGAGTGVERTTDTAIVTPGGDITLDGTALPNVEEFMMEKSQSFEVYRRAFAESVEDNDLFSDAGAVRRMTVTGRVDGDTATRNAFDDALSATLGQDELVTIRDALTGRTFEGMIENYDAVDEAGITRFNEYAVTVVEGTNT